MKTYPKSSNSGIWHSQRFFVMTGEKRAPRKGEWYISGAIPEAYQAPNDLPEECSYHIAREVTQ